MNAITPAATSSDIAAVRQLFEAYSAFLPVDLTLQQIDTEVASLPGSYAAPRGALFLARADNFAAGCIGLRPFSGSVREVKRLYVVPAFRGRGLARSLVSAAIAAGRSIGYEALVLDSLDSIQTAISLFRSFGFEPTEPY